MTIRTITPTAFVAAALVVAGLAWCVQFTARASPGPVRLDFAHFSPLSEFEGDAVIADQQAWTHRRVPLLRRAFLARIYGALPPEAPLSYASQTIDAAAYDGTARMEVVSLNLGPAGAPPMPVAVITPVGAGPFPLIVMADFCGLDDDIDPRLPSPNWRPQRCRSEIGRTLTRLSHGDAILNPPIRTMIARGYAVAAFFTGDIAPDDPILFREAKINHVGGLRDSGAIAAWASIYLSAFDALQRDPRIDPSRIALWGHSRFGKAALLAGALDDRIAVIVANQSGTFGATLASATRGESVAQIVQRFPHWFPQSFAAHESGASTLDQHLLLALLAPRPVLLGNAGLDRWSDPAAAFAAARSASEVYTLFGSGGLSQERMREVDLDADIAFYVRPGGHGVRSSDWGVALDFLDRHL